jgi:hypothetical protein
MSGDRQALRQALYRLAAGQAGFFTAAQALGLGYSYQAQKYHVDHGNWVRVDRGIFVVAIPLYGRIPIAVSIECDTGEVKPVAVLIYIVIWDILSIRVHPRIRIITVLTVQHIAW